MCRWFLIAIVAGLGLAACSDRSGPPADALSPAPNAAVPFPHEVRTCPRGGGCF